MGFFAVIDTETNWHDQVMSIGTVLADDRTFQIIDGKYHVITPEYLVGGMYDHALLPDKNCKGTVCERAQAIRELREWFAEYRVTELFAYNAPFDRNHLPELRGYQWFDIMRMAAYRQYHEKIPTDAPCCATGRLKRGYGVEAMLRLLSGQDTYCETHNAIRDAMDELQIMQLLRIPIADYIPL